MSDGLGPANDREVAPAKINLALAVTGRRADGYHLLDTLVVHGVVGDSVAATVGSAHRRTGVPEIGLRLRGPFAAALVAEPANLVLRAARLLAAAAADHGLPTADLELTLDKRLPIASGIGGGSSDAAATLRLLDRVWRLGFGRERLATLSLELGADLPMCVLGRPSRACGIGEVLEPIAGLPALAMVLVNPRVAVSTPAVFRALTERDNPPLSDLDAGSRSLDRVIAWLGANRNDLQAAAIAIAPVIGEVIAELATRPGCRFTRMSGSGATVFGLFDDLDHAEAAAAEIGRCRPDWWAVAGATGGSAR